MKYYFILFSLFGFLLIVGSQWIRGDAKKIDSVKATNVNTNKNASIEKTSIASGSKDILIQDSSPLVNTVKKIHKSEPIQAISNAPSEQLLFENPDDLATGISELNDKAVISIGEFIPVSFEGDVLNTQTEEEKVIEIGEYLPIDEEDLIASEKEYQEYKRLNPSSADNYEFEDALLLNAVEAESEISEIIEIGEFIPVDLDLPN